MEKGNCPDSWERFSSSVSSLSLNLLATLFFVLIMSYVLVVGLQNASFTITVNGQRVVLTYPGISVPIDYTAIRNSVVSLFGAVLAGLFVPLLSERLRFLKAAVALFQGAVFVWGLYVFVGFMLDFINMMK